MTISEVAPGIRAVDLWDRGLAGRTCGYLIDAPRPTLVETGPARSVPVWLEALDAVRLAPADVAYVVVTHIHLDHAGGAGILLRHLPAAQVVVHRNGARHLVDPGRLVAGARQVFGDRLETYFGLPEPVPEERLRVPESHSELDLGGGRTLRFFDAFGHARHQHMIFDRGSGCLWSGDEFGIRYVNIAQEYVLPNTPPNQFDPDAMLRSAQLLLTLWPEAVLFSHFGRCTLDAASLSARLGEQVKVFAELGRRGAEPPAPEQVHAGLTAHVLQDLAAREIAWTPTVERELTEDLAICAQGIVDYQQRRLRSAGGR